MKVEKNVRKCFGESGNNAYILMDDVKVKTQNTKEMRSEKSEKHQEIRRKWVIQRERNSCI